MDKGWEFALFKMLVSRLIKDDAIQKHEVQMQMDSAP
jgi:hypothetical protein